MLAILFQRMGDPERRDPLTTARRRQAMAAYFVAGNLLGILQHRLWTKQDFLRVAPLLDEMDYRAWLHRTVGSIGERWPELAWDSPLVNDIYNLIFSRRAGFGAGAALYDTLSMLLNYQGHVYYRMNGGMGDVVFAPLYLWLRQRGVRFRFFHRVRALHVDPRTPDRAVSEIMIERQLDGPSHAYDPLISVKGRPCWPNVPLREQLAPAERRRLEETGHDLEASPETFGRIESLRRGRDFDQVVLGIPVGALQAEPELVGELATLRPPLREMIRRHPDCRHASDAALDRLAAFRDGMARGQAMLAPASAPFAAWGGHVPGAPRRRMGRDDLRAQRRVLLRHLRRPREGRLGGGEVRRAPLAGAIDWSADAQLVVGAPGRRRRVRPRAGSTPSTGAPTSAPPTATSWRCRDRRASAWLPTRRGSRTSFWPATG